MRALLLSLTLSLSLAFHLLGAAEAPATYFDEAQKRFLTLEKGAGGTLVTVRFASVPGGFYEFKGRGSGTDRELTFARYNSGMGSTEGPQFLAKVSEARVDVQFKSASAENQDAGINGTYRRVNDSKLLLMAKKEYEAAEDRLQTSLRAAPKKWENRERPALEAWKEQWPTLRQRLLAALEANTVKGQQTTKDWVKAAQATAFGYHFVEALPDSKAPLGWDASYTDNANGHITIRSGVEGQLSVGFASFRIPESEGSFMDTTIPKAQITEEKNGQLKAVFELNRDAGGTSAKVEIIKTGRYLQVKTNPPPAASSRQWFDGVYRAYEAPPPAQ